MPENSKHYKAADLVSEGKEGLVLVRHVDVDGVVSELKLIDKEGLDDLIVEEEIKLHKKS